MEEFERETRLMLPSFPLYKNDGKAVVPLSDFQKRAIKALKDKINSGEYRLTPHACLCANIHSEKDCVLSEKDRYGFEVKTLICSKCGLVRSQTVFTESSNRKFYELDYRAIYVGAESAPAAFFLDQRLRGTRLLDVWKKSVSGFSPKLVFEAGCGAGGILTPFSDSGLLCQGCDFNDRYLAYGRQQGLFLTCGDFREILKDESVELFILSHVMEHFLNPILAVNEILQKIKPGGYLLVEVPGVLNLHRVYFDPVLYLQNAHTYNFFATYLNVFFNLLGLDVVYEDERCIFILKKPLDWDVRNTVIIYDLCLEKYPEKMEKYFLKSHLIDKFKINPYFYARNVLNILKR